MATRVTDQRTIDGIALLIERLKLKRKRCITKSRRHTGPATKYQMTEPETHTFVAPCEGGPLDGKLKRMDRSVQTFTIPAVVNGRMFSPPLLTEN